MLTFSYFNNYGIKVGIADAIKAIHSRSGENGSSEPVSDLAPEDEAAIQAIFHKKNKGGGTAEAAEGKVIKRINSSDEEDKDHEPTQKKSKKGTYGKLIFFCLEFLLIFFLHKNLRLLG